MSKTEEDPAVIRRQSPITRITHWIWAICLFFLLLTGLQIFNAHPTLYVGQQSRMVAYGAAHSNAVLAIGAQQTANGPRGVTEILGHQFDTTGVLGLSAGQNGPEPRAFPAWATIPSFQDLGTGRVIHFFFAWIFVANFVLWIAASLINGHLRRDIVPGKGDARGLGRDILDHLRLKFHRTRSYAPLQRLTYLGVLFILFPLMILTGLTMSPGMDAAWPWLLDLFGGRQTARTLHFVGMTLLVLFFVVHIAMVLLAGPVNELRSMITGRYRIDPPQEEEA